MKTPCFSYLRVSSLGQVNNGTGLDRQHEVCQRYAKRNGLEVVEVFREEGVSGTTEGATRPALSRLLLAVKEQGVKVVLVERADRLARSLIESEKILLVLKKMGVSVINAESGQALTDDTGSPEKVMIRQILGSIAQFDKNCIVQKLRHARDQKSMAAGGRRVEGVKPYGVLPGEEAVIERIFELRRKPKGARRLSLAKIADTLTQEGRQTRQGGRWQARTILGILQRGKAA